MKFLGRDITPNTVGEYLEQILGLLSPKEAGKIMPYDLTVTNNPQLILSRPDWGKIFYVVVVVKDMGDATKIKIGDDLSQNLVLDGYNSIMEFEAPLRYFVDTHTLMIRSDAISNPATVTVWGVSYSNL